MTYRFNGPAEQGGGLLFTLLAQPVKKLRKDENGNDQIHALHINLDDEKAPTFAWSGSQEEFDNQFTEHEEEPDSKA